MPPTSYPDQSIAKSGWLFRRSTVLKRWKKSWIVLFRNGRLAYYDDPYSSTAEDLIDIPNERAIIVGPDYCRDVEPPLGKLNDLLFGVKTRARVWHMCADDKDDLMAWKLALQEALQAFQQNAHSASGQGAYAGYVLPSNEYGYGNYGNGQYTVYAPPGSTVTVTDRGPVIYQPDGRVVYVFEQHPYYRNYCGRNAGLGLLTGAALGSMLFWPWWGMWWWI